jgi:hypothetical protein
MKTWFARSVTRLGHLSDETITKLINGELSSYREFRANSHLNKCWQCKARREALEKASFQVVEYRKYQLERCQPLNPRRRQDFLTRLDQVWEETTAPTWRSRLSEHLRFLPAPRMNPVYTSTFVVALAAVLLFLIWHRNPPPMSSGTFLAQAVQAEERQAAATTSGVIYQKIEIRARTHTIQRAIYRDASRKRKPRPVVLEPEVRTLQTELVSGGVDWDQPLSARDYAQWHERQSVIRDDVHPSGEGLLTLTSTVPAGPVAAESLTVRVADFHPIERTVAMRDSDNIEIAEVHYDVLGWDAVNDALFEPLGHPPAVSAIASALPDILSPEQLDLAELQARLVLNGLHADSTEQLEFQRSRSSIEVKGLVDSDERKRQLVAALRTVPHVVPAIFSVADLSVHSSNADSVSSIEEFSTVAVESPLERFLRARGESTEDLNGISQKLLDAALSIKQESTAISELRQRFGNDQKLDDAGKSTLRRLFEAHMSQLVAATDEEDTLVVRVIGAHPANGAGDNGAAPAPSSLAAEGSTPLNLCRELISSDNSTEVNVPDLATQLLKSTQSLRISAHKVLDDNSGSPKNDPPSINQR